MNQTSTTVSIPLLSHATALALVKPAVQCAVDVVTTPTGPTEATQWVARVRVREKGGSLPWVDAATGEPKPSANEARGDVVLAYLAEVARDAHDVARGVTLGEPHREAAAAVLGRVPSDGEVSRAIDAFDAAYVGREDGSGVGEDVLQRAGWRAFAATLIGPATDTNDAA